MISTQRCFIIPRFLSISNAQIPMIHRSVPWLNSSTFDLWIISWRHREIVCVRKILDMISIVEQFATRVSLFTKRYPNYNPPIKGIFTWTTFSKGVSYSGSKSNLSTPSGRCLHQRINGTAGEHLPTNGSPEVSKNPRSSAWSLVIFFKCYHFECQFLFLLVVSCWLLLLLLLLLSSSSSLSNKTCTWQYLQPTGNLWIPWTTFRVVPRHCWILTG